MVTVCVYARRCKLARAGSAPATFAREAVRASWPAGICGPHYWRTPHWQQVTLLLPWRLPITTISVTEGDVELVDGTDFRLLGAGVVERLKGGLWPISAALVVDYTAGWVPDSGDASYDEGEDPMPADLVAAIADQVKLAFFQRPLDPTLRSEDVPGIWSGIYNVAGGDTIGEDGMLYSLQCALDPYRNPSGLA